MAASYLRLRARYPEAALARRGTEGKLKAKGSHRRRDRSFPRRCALFPGGENPGKLILKI
jgi:hypothetical protein